MTGEPLDWSAGAPRSPRFDDIYFSPDDGLAETRAVFLQGCGLPETWKGRDRFTVAELGFGTGLNVLALLELWARTRPPGARLHIFSVEGFPLSRGDAERALAAWPELASLATRLLAQWPDGRRGFHRIAFEAEGAILDLAVSEAVPALDAWSGRADAWFLDGFAPARNPQMWSPELLALVGARSNPGARAATFTVAGAVRRGLEAAGFSVEKKPGFGRKRERLEGRLGGRLGDAPPVRRSPRVAIVGAGVAGAALARAFRALGAAPVVYEAVRPGAGASGNPAALVAPRLDAGFGAGARLSAQAFARAVRLYRPEAVIARGAVQLARTARDPGRFARIAAWNGFAPGALQPLSPEEAAAALDEPAGPEGLMIRDALVVEPAAAIAAWLEGVEVRREAVADLAALDAEVVCLAAGAAAAGLASLPIRPVRGQASWADGDFTGAPAAWGGYAVPTRSGVLFGATHDRGETSTETRAADHGRNLAVLAEGRPRLAAALADAALGGRAGVRATTADHLPLTGALGAGRFVLSGLGGRGFTLAPLLAEHVAALALERPSPLPRDLAGVVEPLRFATEQTPAGV